MIISSCSPAQAVRFPFAGLTGSSLRHESKHSSSSCVCIPTERRALPCGQLHLAWEKYQAVSSWHFVKKKWKIKLLVLRKWKAEVRAREAMMLLSARKENPVPWDPLLSHIPYGISPKTIKDWKEISHFIEMKTELTAFPEMLWMRKVPWEAEPAVSQVVIQAELITSHQVASFCVELHKSA